MTTKIKSTEQPWILLVDDKRSGAHDPKASAGSRSVSENRFQPDKSLSLRCGVIRVDFDGHLYFSAWLQPDLLTILVS